MKIDGIEWEFMVDTGSLVIISPATKEMTNNKEMARKNKYQDVKKNEVNFLGKIAVEAKSKRIGKKLIIHYSRKKQ